MEQAISGVRETPTGNFEVTINHHLLPKGRAFRTFDTAEEGGAFRTLMLAQLNRGKIPTDLQPQSKRMNPPRPPARKSMASPVARQLDSSQAQSIRGMILGYMQSASIAYSSREYLEVLAGEVKGSVSGITHRWAADWVKSLKDRRLSPGTIRKKVEALGRALDWKLREDHGDDPGDLPNNPLRMMPKGYSSYKEAEDAPVDSQRDYRLPKGADARIQATIKGEKRDDRERAWADNDTDFLMLYRLIVNTGLRLREAYRLRVSDIQFGLKTIQVRKGKTGLPRPIPIMGTMETWLMDYIGDRDDDSPLFPYWGGSNDVAVLRRVSGNLSSRFKSLFSYVEAPHLTEHDLRHEAVCRWVEMRNTNGRWTFRTEEVRRITGHKNEGMFIRYLSLRGSDLADRVE